MKYFDPIVTERYAQALFEVARRQGKLQVICDSIGQLHGLESLSNKLSVFLDSPQISTESKLGLFEKAMRGRVDDLLVDFMDLLLRKQRIDHMRPIFKRYSVLVQEDQGLHAGTVQTAVALDDSQKATLKDSLERYMGKRLVVKWMVDPEVVGGVRFKSGDLLLDDTVQAKLQRLRERLVERLKQ